MIPLIRRSLTAALMTVVLAACGGADQTGTATGDEVSPQAEESVMPDMTPAMSEEAMPSEVATTDAMGAEDDAMGDVDHVNFSFGSPADAGDAERTISVETIEEGGFAYQPASIEVAAGETVTFEVANVGEAVHEFVLGDTGTQQAHEEEMAEMGGGMAHDEPNALVLQPGETKTLTWTFSEPGTLLYGCHEPGHYDAGMVGEITVG